MQLLSLHNNQISDTVRNGDLIKEYKGFLVDDDLNIYNKASGKKLSPYLGADGYMHVSRRENGKVYRNRVHVIYAHCFIPKEDGCRYVNHKDSNKLNNKLSNLEWCTNSYNVYHGWHSGNRIHKNNTKVIVFDLNNNEIGRYGSIRKCGEALHLDRHKIARVLNGELRPDCLGYYFKYDNSCQETIENIA